MRRLFHQTMVSADGFMSGPNGELDWHVVDDDFTTYVDGMLRSVDAILLGRRTYEGLASYWPSATEPEAALMNGLPKVVFSRTLHDAGWHNTRVVAGDAVDEVRRLKAQRGKDLALFASSTLATALVAAGLVDEYRILVCPVLLGEGRPVLDGTIERAELRLARHEILTSGTALLTYENA